MSGAQTSHASCLVLEVALLTLSLRSCPVHGLSNRTLQHGQLPFLDPMGTGRSPVAQATRCPPVRNHGSPNPQGCRSDPQEKPSGKTTTRDPDMPSECWLVWNTLLYQSKSLLMAWEKQQRMAQCSGHCTHVGDADEAGRVSKETEDFFVFTFFGNCAFQVSKSIL